MIEDKPLRPLLIWTIALIGWPIVNVILILTASFNDSVNSNAMSYVMSLSGVSLWGIFSVTNVVFSFYTLIMNWKTLSLFNRAKYLLICLLLNIFSAYFMVSFWKKRNVNMFSIIDKKKMGAIPVIFYFLILISITFPILVSRTVFES